MDFLHIFMDYFGWFYTFLRVYVFTAYYFVKNVQSQYTYLSTETNFRNKSLIKMQFEELKNSSETSLDKSLFSIIINAEEGDFFYNPNEVSIIEAPINQLKSEE